MAELGYVGVLAIELFQVGERLLGNEMAPRVHNSGHWTIEGAEVSQFEKHLRAVTGLPLGSTQPVGVSAMVNLIGEMPDAAEVLAIRGAHLHDYGKGPRPGRKLGHVTVRADDEDELESRLRSVLAAAAARRDPGPSAGCPLGQPSGTVGAMFSRRLTLTAMLSAIVVAILLPVASASAATVALWHMNESSGPMVDSSGSGNNGTLTNVTRVNGSFDGSKAYSFNGSSSKVTVPNDASLNPSSQNVTITVHVKFGQVPSASVIDYDLVRKQSSAGTYKVEILRTGKAFCKFRGTSKQRRDHRGSEPRGQLVAHDRVQEDVVERHAHGRRLLLREER